VRYQDGGAWHEWLEAVRQPLLRYCMQVTGSRWEGEDLVQDTLLRLLQSGAERPEQDFGFYYACRTARNLWIDRYRRAKRVKPGARADTAELASEGREGRSGHSNSAPIRESDAAMNVREHLEELAWRLPPKPFVILILMEVFDFTAKETAGWIGGTEVAVQVALSRARSRLKSLVRTDREERTGGSGSKHVRSMGSPLVPSEFFESVLDAFRRRHPPAIQEAYLMLVASGGKLQGIRALSGRLYFTFLDPDGNQLMVTA